MKIVCLIRPIPPCIYFVNRINEKHKVSLVITETLSFRRRIINKLKLQGISGSIEAIRNKILKKGKEKKYLIDYSKYFFEKWKFINTSITTFHVEDINSRFVYKQLKREQPDLVLDHGTSVVKNHILETAKMSLNLHWGLSPYYRGTHCTEWALINWDPYNIGVTIHKLTSVIDGGDILAQKRATIKPCDSVNSINMQLTKLGTELIIEVIENIKSGKQLQFKPQDYSLGIMTAHNQWSNYLDKQIEYIEKNNLIKLMLKKPARRQYLPIVEL